MQIVSYKFSSAYDVCVSGNSVNSSAHVCVANKTQNSEEDYLNDVHRRCVREATDLN